MCYSSNHKSASLKCSFTGLPSLEETDSQKWNNVVLDNNLTLLFSWSLCKMSSAHHKLLTWSLPHLLLLPLTYLLLLAPPTGVSANLCRVTGGVLGMHWSSVISLGWHSLARGRGGATCWEACCLTPGCSAVWSLGGQCVLLRCARTPGCPVSSLPQAHRESLGLLQLLSKNPTAAAAASPGVSGVSGVSAPTAAAPGPVTTPTQAGKGAALACFQEPARSSVSSPALLEDVRRLGGKSSFFLKRLNTRPWL
ncbi:hypothetical protein EYF80_055884 [Liparis tanakae]|uniref:MANSC domain-containing protein n=1 Tax=Liparis tanakae TaxID=230148 RepID=A0A4Z2F0D0_9TELE|nr:hypothetical protein EYF80_055884 [Liparis tanakae]